MTRQKQPKPKPGWLNKSAMAASLGISVQAFDKWGVEPIQRIGTSAYFDARSVLDNRLAYEARKQQQSAPVDKSELEQKKLEEDYRWTRERRIAQQNKNEVTSKRQVPTEFAIFALSRIASEMASTLDTVPLSIRRKHPDLEPRHIDGLNRELARARNMAAAFAGNIGGIYDEYLRTIEEEP